MRVNQRSVFLSLLIALIIAFALGCSNSNGNSKKDSGPDGDTNKDTGTDSEGDSESTGDTDSDADTDAGVDTNTNMDTDSSSESDINDVDTYSGGDKTGEVCGNSIDDDSDGFMDCADAECETDDSCVVVDEICDDGLDNDFDGLVDCLDSDCSDVQINCESDCSNGIDDDGDLLVDCEDDNCAFNTVACGNEVCGDNVDNDNDGDFDCDDSDCIGSTACGYVLSDGGIADGGSDISGGMMCSYGGDEPHECACNDAIDNDGDQDIDNADIHCFGPYDDDEESFATGIKGDNEGSKGSTECPFDGNSGGGNDDLCCLTDPSLNVTPNGCDDRGCCELDINRNGTGEFVSVKDECEFAPTCETENGTHGCACDTNEQCDEGQFCIADSSNEGFCSKCEPCTSNVECSNPCECGEICFGGFVRPPEECGATSDGDADTDTDGDADNDTDTDIDGDTDADTDSDTDIDTDVDTDTDTDVTITCPNDLTACPDGNCGVFETCLGGCCYPQCEDGVTPCNVSSDCDQGWSCITGCCILFAPV